MHTAWLQAETISLAHPGRHDSLPTVRGLSTHQAAYAQLGEAHTDRDAL